MNSMPMNGWMRYVGATTAYTVVHKAPLLRDGKLRVYVDNKVARREMLVGDKAAVLAVSTIYSPILTPFWVVNDVNKLDIRRRGLREEDCGYSQDRDFADYVMA
jgi:hypothetical protein